MIVQLRIKNYALIEHLEMMPFKGLNIITGETGAGKSIMLGAVGLLMGNRADTKTLSNHDEKCVIEGEFDLSGYPLKGVFEEADLDYEPISIFRREISPTGKSRAFINDTPVTLDTMRSIGKYLMNIHSQHQTLALGNKDFQLQLVDLYAENTTLLLDYANTYAQYRNAEREYATLVQEQKSNNEQSEYDTFLLDELSKANFQEGEQEKLEEELRILEHAEEIKAALFQSFHSLSESEFATLPSLQEVKMLMANLSKISEKYEEISQRLESTYIELQDVAQTISIEQQSIEIDPQRLEEVQERLSLLFRLQQKHNVATIEELIRVRTELEVKSERNFDIEEELSKAKKLQDQLQKEVIDLAEALSKRRTSAFAPLKKKLELLLSELGMENAIVAFEDEKVDPDRFGTNRITLKFSANKGVEAQSIKLVASGGELSRLMFCIKYVLANKMALPTIVFDEIDSGISGEIALKMGKMMREMAKNHQVITITHLPQMASYGTAHFYVYKDNDEATAKSSMRVLKQEERELEIAKMIGGEQPSAAAFESAKELLINSSVTLD